MSGSQNNQEAGRERTFGLVLIFGFVCVVPPLFFDDLHAFIRFGPFVLVCLLAAGVKWRAPGLSGHQTFRSEVDDRGVRRVNGTAIIEEVQWKDLVRVTIMTTDEGPFVEDFYWMFYSNDGSGCAIPAYQACPIDLLGWLQQLPGFDNMAVIEASSCTDWAEFHCWQGLPGEAKPRYRDGMRR